MGKTTNARKLHDNYIAKTARRSPVTIKRILLSRLQVTTLEGIQKKINHFACERVYLSTIALKHIFDGRGAQEYDAMLENMEVVIEKPDEVYENLSDKRGTLLFVKTFVSITYEQETLREWLLCSLDVGKDEIDVVTVFRFTDERKKKNYLKKYKLLWNWEGDDSPS